MGDSHDNAKGGPVPIEWLGEEGADASSGRPGAVGAGAGESAVAAAGPAAHDGRRCADAALPRTGEPDRMVLDRSDLATGLDELAALDYVVRRVDPADRRRKIVAITATGKKQLVAMDQLIYAAEAELLEPLSASERKTLLELLGRLTAE